MKALTVLLSVGVLFYSCSQGEEASTTSDTPADITPGKGQSGVDDSDSDPNVLRVAINSPDHSTLVEAVVASEMEDVLANNGPFTVFAPNNAAFDALPEGTLEDLLKPENRTTTLKRIITHHAAPGTYKADDLRDGQMLYQATGIYLEITRDGDDVYVAGNKILGSVDASNGVVHVIDAVLLPPEE